MVREMKNTVSMMVHFVLGEGGDEGEREERERLFFFLFSQQIRSFLLFLFFILFCFCYTHGMDVLCVFSLNRSAYRI